MIGKWMAITVVAIISILLFIRLLAWADRHDRAAEMRQKACWQEITAIIEGAPPNRADWIKQTVRNRVSLLGGVNYCKVLEFIRNGDDK
mgnify:FL=1